MAANITTEIINLTPEYAAELLTKNTRNRGMSRPNYLLVRRAIENGEWELNGEAIKISHSGQVLDGQHRCQAVVDTGITIQTVIIRGLPDETQDTMDTGKTRTLSDFLAINGEKNTNTLSALIKRYIAMERTGKVSAAFAVGSKAGVITAREALRWFENNQWARDYVAPAREVSGYTPLGASTSGVLIYAFETLDEEDSKFFWARVKDGVNLNAGHPILALNKAYKNLTDDSRGERNQRYLAAITIKAWNAYRDGDDILLLRFRSGGANPDKFPEPK